MRNYYIKVMQVTSLFLLTFLNINAQNEDRFKFENSQTIEEYVNTHALDFKNEDVFVFNDFEAFIKFNNEGYLAGPLVHVFNDKGLYLESIEPYEVEKKLSNFKKIKNKPSKKAILVDDWFNNLVNYKTQEPIVKKDKVDYYFVLNWALFLKKPDSVKELSKWYKVLQRQQTDRDENIHIVLLNMDFQDSWNMSKEKREHLLKVSNQ
ncbi:hypothetical protein ACFQ3R_09670 [Mesonia ostreae]|uniref:Uncharacterized protein n=1 Tax=Mesonia ostreae TaxID=861110 RepID=A0ABU2KED5_9FLAO|nr:hypothetical protein [Mesonia ostreae]MDT0293067.1 hypothetical protein [Mesonia ostreae]